MSPTIIFLVDLFTGYLAASVFVAVYVWPKLKAMEGASAMRLIAAIHSFRYYGLSFLLPGVVGAGLPSAFAGPAAFADYATGVLAIMTLISYKAPKLFWPLAWLFNLVGFVDLVADTANAIRLGLPAFSGQLGANYAIVTVYVPLLFVTHIVAFRLLVKGEAPERHRVGSGRDRLSTAQS